MFAMLVFAAALINFNFVYSRASNEDQFYLEHFAKIFSEDDMTPDFTEQLSRHDHSTDIKKRKEEKYGPPRNEVRPTTKPVAEKPVKSSTARNLSEPNTSGRNVSVRNALGRNGPERNAPGRNAPGRNALGRNAPGRNAPGRNAPGRNAPGRNASDGGEKSQILQEEMDVVDREDHVTQYLSDQLVNTDSEITSLQASDAEDERGDSVEVKEDSFFAFLTGQERAVEIEGAWSRPVDNDLLARS